MIKIRAIFEKKERAKYISHLDLNRCMLRTFRRSGLPIWYTEGYNPHPYYSFALALSLGFESNCEILDFNLNEEIPFDEVRDKLNEVMPDGMKIVSAQAPKLKITAIAKAEYLIKLKCDDLQMLSNDVARLLNSDEIIIEKKTKKGMKSVDIKPLTELVKCQYDDNVLDLTMRFPAGTQTNYNPMLFIGALKNLTKLQFETYSICRTGILCENNEIFS